MKSKLLFFLFLLASVWGWGQIILSDDFNYTGNLTNNGWSAHSGGGTQPINTTTGLSLTGYVGSNIGNAANIDNNGEDVNRTFSSQTTGDVYLSFLFQANSSNSAGYFLNLGSGAASAGTFHTRVFVNGTGTGIGISETGTVGSYTPITAGNTYLVVIKREIETALTKLYVFDSLPTSEPTTANLSYTGTVSNVDYIALRQYNVSPVSYTHLTLPTKRIV